MRDAVAEVDQRLGIERVAACLDIAGGRIDAAGHGISGIAVLDGSGVHGAREAGQGIAIGHRLVGHRDVDHRLLAVDRIRAAAETGRVVGRGFVAVVAEAPAAGADQRRQTGAAADAAGVERRPATAADGEGRAAGDEDVATGGGAGGSIFTGVENDGAAGGVGRGDVLRDRQVAAQGFDAHRAAGSDAVGGSHRADGQRIAVDIGERAGATGGQGADVVGGGVERNRTCIEQCQAAGRDRPAAGIGDGAGAVERQRVAADTERASHFDAAGGVEQGEVVAGGQCADGDLAGAVAAADGDAGKSVLQISKFGGIEVHVTRGAAQTNRGSRRQRLDRRASRSGYRGLRPGHAVGGQRDRAATGRQADGVAREARQFDARRDAGAAAVANQRQAAAARGNAGGGGSLRSDPDAAAVGIA